MTNTQLKKHLFDIHGMYVTPFTLRDWTEDETKDHAYLHDLEHFHATSRGWGVYTGIFENEWPHTHPTIGRPS
jgi:hypothetical protein